jgi:hypothetical protein
MKKLIAATTIVAALVVPASASALTRQFEGRIVSVNRDNHTFRIHDSERGTKRIKVRPSTDFERVTFAKLRKGMRRIEVTAKRKNRRWVALDVERSGGGGRHGGGADDRAGDDHGGRGRGGDDRGGDDHGGRHDDD